MSAVVTPRRRRRSLSGLTPEQKQEHKRAIAREQQRRRRADTKKNAATNAARRKKYLEDLEYRERRREAAREYHNANAAAQNAKRYQRHDYQLKRTAQIIRRDLKRVAGWRWEWDRDARIGGIYNVETITDAQQFDAAMEAHDAWFDSLDDSDQADGLD